MKVRRGCQNLLELELEMVVSYCVGGGGQTLKPGLFTFQKRVISAAPLVRFFSGLQPLEVT